MSNNVLEVKDLQVEFKVGKKYIVAVTDVSFDIEQGKTFGVVGESGCGKSVSASSIIGLLPKRTSKISKGSIVLDGKELLGIKTSALNQVRGKEVSMIFQEPMTSLNPVHTIGAQLREMFYAHTGRRTGENGRTEKVSREEADAECIRMLTEVGITDPASRMKEYPHQLSGGMRQRVMIAMALLCNPKLLIADEPTTALDVTIQAQILDLMRKLQKEKGTSILLITHDMGVIANYADVVAVMYAGKIVEYNDVTKIFKDPKCPYTFGLLKSVPRVDEDVNRLYTIYGTVPTLEEMPAGCRFYNRCSYCCDICTKEDPGLIDYNGGKVRCWMYRDDAPEDIKIMKKKFEQDTLEAGVSAGTLGG